MSILVWFLIGFIVYSFVIVPIMMELSLDKTRKTPDGKLRVKKSGFVIEYLYKANLCQEKEYTYWYSFCLPKNTCQLYKGLWWGIIFSTGSAIAVMGLMAIFISFIIFFCSLISLVSPVAIILGFMPKSPVEWVKELVKNKEEIDELVCFYPYERIGTKKWIAPWKIILPIGIGALIYLFPGKIYHCAASLLMILSSKTATIVYVGIAGLILLIISINKARKRESFVASKEVALSFFKKFCKKIELT